MGLKEIWAVQTDPKHMIQYTNTKSIWGNMKKLIIIAIASLSAVAIHDQKESVKTNMSGINFTLFGGPKRDLGNAD